MPRETGLSFGLVGPLANIRQAVFFAFRRNFIAFGPMAGPSLEALFEYGYDRN